MCFLYQKYNKGRYNNIHGTIEDIHLYTEQKNKLGVGALKIDFFIM